MLNFRPHTLQRVRLISGGTAPDGALLPDTEQIEAYPCHIETNTSAAQALYDDGRAANYAYVVFLNRDCPTFSIGERVRLFGIDGQPLQGDKEHEVKGFSRNQLNARLWV